MIKSLGAKIYAAIVHKKNQKWITNPIETQKKVFKKLILEGSKTRFGREHHFQNIHTQKDFQKAIPVRDYEGLKSYIDAVLEGESDVLWPGRPLYYAKSSGTTS